MKAKFSGIGIVAGSGKIGGSVASRNSGGAYFRVKVSPLNPQTISQAAARNKLASFSQGWRSLTESQRDSFNSAVDGYTTTDIFGDSIKPSGKNLYTRLNINLSNVGVSPITSPLLPSSVASMSSLSLIVDVSSSQFDVVFAPTPVVANQAFIVEASPCLSLGKKFVKNLYRKIGFIDSAATSPATFWSEYSAKFGTPVSGTKIFIRVKAVNKLTGQSGVYFSASAIVTT